MSVASAERRSRRFGADALVMIAGTGFSQLVLLGVMPIITRLYSPDAVSLHAMLVAVAAPLVVLATLRLDLAIVIARDSADVGRLARTVFSQAAVVSLVLLVLAPIVGRYLFTSVGGGNVGYSWMVALSISVLSLSLFHVASGQATRAGRFRQVASSNVALSAVFAIVAIGLGLFGAPEQGIAGARTAGQLAALGVLAVGGCLLFQWLRPARISHLRRVWFDHRQFLQFNTPYSLIGTVARDAPLYFFAAVGEVAFVAYYALARMVVLAPTSLVSSSISRVFHRHAAEHWGTIHLQQFVRSLTRIGLWCSLPAFALIITWGDAAFGMVFGRDWRTAGEVAMLLAAPLWLSLQNGWPERTFEVARRQSVSFRIQVVFDLANVSALVVTYWLTGDVLLAVGAFATTYTVYQITYLIAVYRVASFPIRPLLCTLALAFIAMALTVTALGVIRLVDSGYVAFGASCALVLALTGIVALITTPFGSRILRRRK